MSEFSADDHRFMARALRLARRGQYTTHPNPRVGCVVVREGRIVGEGWHAYAGEAHAEVLALRAAGGAARGSTAYVTLEPCAHQGRTPPCADALIAAGVSRVVAAMQDPNPAVAGGGLQRLTAAGIATESGLLAAQAAALNRGFIRRMQSGRPWVRIKFGASLDGRTALGNGFSQWITGAAARQDVQLWRARADCILTGVGTVLADDPALTLRLPPPGLELGQLQQPLRVVLDSRLRTSPQARMLALPGQTLIMTAPFTAVDLERETRAEQLRTLRRVEILETAVDDHGRIDPAAALGVLGRREVNEVQVEAGAVLCGGLLAAGLVDELLFYLAPCLLGDDGFGLFRLPGIQSMQDRIELKIEQVRQIGEDLRIRARPLRHGSDQ